MATLREHLKADIADIELKLKTVPAEMLDRSILELRAEWDKISQHFYSERVDAEEKAAEATSKS